MSLREVSVTRDGAAPTQRAAQPEPPVAPGPPGRVGYVVKSYPRFSETFIVREILAREAAGEAITIASLRPPRDPRFHSALAQVQAPVAWIPHHHRTLEATWAALRTLREAGVALTPTALEALFDEEPAVAAQGAQLAAWALEQGVCHLHSHFASVSGRTARLAHHLTGIPWTLTAHAKDIFHQDNDPARLVPVLTEVDAVVAVSDMTADWIRTLAPRARVRRIYNGLEVDEIRWSSPLHRPRTIVSVGRLVEKKGLPDLLAAVALLRDRGVACTLELAGDGPVRPQLEELIDRLALRDRVALLGPLPQHDVLALIASGAVFAAPCVVASDGDRDGLPTVILESMALGTPVVATPVAGIPEAVEHGSSGLLVGERDVDALAAALEALLDDAEARVRYAVAARARIEERFDVVGQAAALRALTAEAGARAPADQAGAHARGGEDRDLAAAPAVSS